MSGRLRLNDRGYFEAPALNVLAFSNWYDGNFSDSKIAGVELIMQEVRTATNGDVRLSPTPAQWDATPTLLERRVDASGGAIETELSYPDHGVRYTVRVAAHEDGVLLSVDLAEPLPPALVGRAGLNLEFLPAAYWGKAYIADGQPGQLPRYPSAAMRTRDGADPEPEPCAVAQTLVLAPEDPARRVRIEALSGSLALFDGRNTAQNGWFVVRTLLPAGRSGTVAQWLLQPSSTDGWLRPPVIGHAQVGYHPEQRKVAVIERDRRDTGAEIARLLRFDADGAARDVLAATPAAWGEYLRYQYATFDFSAVRECGVYALTYGGVRTAPFPIAADVYDQVWQPTLDVFLPVQMDHMAVREAYRVWHGAPHLDDARQAPVNHAHFDLYGQGPTTDSPYAPGEHIAGLDVGGWFDAGDFDIRTQTQYAVVLDLAQCWERFGIARDTTTVDQARRYVGIHEPDGVPDLLQQIEHGTLALLAQHRAVGHAIAGIVEPDLRQYTHLGDASTKTDNQIFQPGSAAPADDRWAFTSRSTALSYGSAAALAAASRALETYRPELAAECLATARQVWDDEHGHAPDRFAVGNTTGGRLETEELKAAVELLIATEEPRFAARIGALWPIVEADFGSHAGLAVRALPWMDAAFAEALEARTRAYAAEIDALAAANPFGVPISTGGWAGNGQILRFGLTNALLHQAFPELIDRETVFRSLHYVFGCHPGSDISFVSGVGAVSKERAYGNNRADFSFIAGGIVPGVLIVKPDFPENKEDWPFLWGQNEYVVDVAATFLLLVSVVRALLAAEPHAVESPTPA